MFSGSRSGQALFPIPGTALRLWSTRPDVHPWTITTEVTDAFCPDPHRGFLLGILFDINKARCQYLASFSCNTGKKEKVVSQKPGVTPQNTGKVDSIKHLADLLGKYLEEKPGTCEGVPPTNPRLLVFPVPYQSARKPTLEDYDRYGWD